LKEVVITPVEMTSSLPGLKLADQPASVPLDLELPLEFMDFLGFADGGTGDVGSIHLILYSGKQISRINDEYSSYRQNLLLLGADGGGQAFCYDPEKQRYGTVHLMDLGTDEPIWFGTKLISALRKFAGLHEGL
jgi:hypothetical protein